MIVTLRIDGLDKVMSLEVSKERVYPKFLYYLCEKILAVDHKVDDWQKWSIKLRDTDCFVIIQLQSMDNWDKK